ncbi:MAG: glycoside hydrolase family 127 protein, partial [Marinoscillum sp.]
MKQLLIIFTLLTLLIGCESAEEVHIQLFPLDQVELLDGPFKQAQQTDLNYILEMDVDRLLAPFMIEAGLDPLAPKYPNWEGDGLSGHIGGHYLSALAMMYAATGNEEIKNRFDYMLDWLQKCQQAHGNGYLGGITDGARIWAEIAKGDIRADYFSLNGGWVPLYNIHKIFAGLKDAHLYTGSETALHMWVELSDWWLDMTGELSEEQFQQMLKSEHGGLNEVFADLYAITNDQEYLAMAEKLSHHVLLDPLLQKEDHLTGMHANTQIPKVIGYQRVAQVSDKSSWTGASRFFWETVVQNRSVAFGGNSVREHFHGSGDFNPMVTSEQGPETCNTYNMMRLSKMLFESSADTRFIDFYERAQLNHILSSQHPDGGFVYFTPARPRHYRVYSLPDQGMWCCVGSGLENHTKYGEFIYA